VVAEFVASDRGLGYLLLQYNGDLNTKMVFAAIIVLSGIGVAIYFLAELLERILIPWRAPAENQVDIT
jgi:NitT/TauT family transport system permease protein